jgi:predicted membrane-bound spermidine synthase
LPKHKRREEFARELSSSAPPPPPGPSFRLRIALLLIASGACALVYQVAWLRSLRLVFGTTTAATGTTLAIFLGGLGIGALLLGRRADRAADPLRLYAWLELGVALGALASLPLIALLRSVYLAAGGESALGPVAATVLRIGLCVLVLGPPTFLMGGTLPAAVRVLEHAADRSRRTVGLLYGVNTLGAVVGVSWATFVSLEQWGTALTVLGAGALNLIVAGFAFALTQRSGGRAQRRQEARARGREAARPPQHAVDATPSAPAAPVWLVLGASGAVGAAFLSMELVWYRMLAPILGGSTYTIGLVLALALLGIGAGGLLYAAGRTERRPTLLAFTVTCLLEAFFIALPYALGDRVALFAMDLRTWAGPSLPALVATWAAVTAVVALPAAVVAGYQFPLLIALLGTREHAVGREVGWAYATNTAGAIAGSLAAGFGLLPLLTAPGLWRAVVYLLLGLAAVSAAHTLRQARPSRWLALAAVLGVLDVVLCAADGPTAFWRHTAIGAGRVETTAPGANGVRRLLNSKRAGVLWEAEGKESSIALDRFDAYTLVVNGKSDGNALGDAPTMVMSGLLGALLHPEVKRALVIGLGSGSSAGWLAALPSIERVDVLELEREVLHVAEECSLVNQSVLKNPKVRIILGDGREFLLTTPERYDLIFSQPSNPYRAGVASLFTREYYRAAAARLRPGGVFVQWLQAYDIHPRSVAAVYATLGAVFPSVETWETIVGGDLLFTASLEPRAHDSAALRARLTTEPFQSAMERVWGVSGIEGLFSAYVANAAFAANLARDSGRINTDDRSFLEFEFARSVGQDTVFAIQGLRAAAARRNQDRPQMTGTVDWERLQELRGIRVLRSRFVPPEEFVPADPAGRARALARQAYATGKFAEARRHWLAQGGGAQAPLDLTVLAEIFVGLADATARRSIDALRPQQPAEAEALAARERYEAGDKAAATRHLITAFELYRHDPWAHRPVFERAMQLASRIASEEPAQRDALFEALTAPFAVRALDMLRLSTRAWIGLQDGAGHLCGAALAPLEPHVLWDRDLLQMRADCYGRMGSPLAARARADLDAFRAAAAAGGER